MQAITETEIAYAENLLFSRTGVFDEERKRFIREMNTCDLQAVPGSGKTTVLLAKLLIIEKRLPFADHRAVLVISHTNAAVDEIRHKIGKHCPRLFSEPNFVGTIQSFVDKFLAIPYYIQIYRRKPNRIDDEIYTEYALKYPYTPLAGFRTTERNNALSYLRRVDTIRGKGLPDMRITPGQPNDRLTLGYMGSDLNINTPPGRNWTDVDRARIADWILAYKRKQMDTGYLCFDDAYYLAEKYIQQFPQVVQILTQRFKFVFVDEMQDMLQHQYQLLEDVFGPGGNCAYQRIGDKNQAIFTGKNIPGSFWLDRALIHQITGSHRLSPVNAAIVQKLALSPIAVRGLRTNPDGTSIQIKPHLLVYTDANILQVIPRFAGLIQQFQASGQIDANCRHSFKAVCWNTQPEAGKVRITDFYPHWERENTRPMVNYFSLESYLYILPTDRTMRSISINILNALLKVLRLERVSMPDGRYYSKTSLMEFLKVHHPVEFASLKLQLFTWSRDVLLSREPAVLQEIRVFVPIMLSVFGKAILHSNTFINPAPGGAVPAAAAPIVSRSNIINAHGIDIEVATVHATKGQTHTGTLYLESFYERNVQNLGSYESQRLAGFLLDQVRPVNLHQHVQQSLKIAYVGFSRPTHLLCFAVHENRFNERLTNLDPSDWEIVHV